MKNQLIFIIFILIFNLSEMVKAEEISLYESYPNSLTPGAPPYVGAMGNSDNTNDDLIITFTVPVTAAGLFFIDSGSSNPSESVTFSDPVGNVIKTLPFPVGGMNEFLGITVDTDSATIGSILISEDSDDGDDVSYDNIIFGTSADVNGTYTNINNFLAAVVDTDIVNFDTFPDSTSVPTGFTNEGASTGFNFTGNEYESAGIIINSPNGATLSTVSSIFFDTSDDDSSPTSEIDTDGDDVPDDQDNCPNIYNSNQTDSNGNGTGDACEQGIITIDGNAEEWSSIPATNIMTDYTDEQGNSLCGSNADIKRIVTAMDDYFVYVMVETYGTPINPDSVIEMNFDYKPGQHHTHDSNDDLGSNIHGDTLSVGIDNDLDGNDENYLLEGYQIAWGSIMEIRIPLSELENPSYFYSTFVNIWDYDFPLIFPGMGCNGISTVENNSDGDCDSCQDETVQETYYLDTDSDGYGDPNNSTQAEIMPSGYVTDNSDCNDLDDGIHPAATEIRGDGIDQDCNQKDAPTSFYDDVKANDIQSVDLSSEKINGSDTPGNQIPVGTTVVFQTNEGRYGKIEIQEYTPSLVINWETYHADGSVVSTGKDFTIDPAWSYDMDNGIKTTPTSGDSDFLWEIVDETQKFITPKNDALFALYSDSQPGLIWYEDHDGDGYGHPDRTMASVSQPSGYVADNTDCNDYNSSIHPGATDIEGDGIDQNCNGDIPNRPDLVSPSNGSTDVSLTPILIAGAFTDPDLGDIHLKTRWQISTFADFSNSTLVNLSEVHLKSLPVPDLALQENTTYYWRVKYQDNQSNTSEWSDSFSMTTLQTQKDTNVNGIPDTLENDTVDLDQDGTADIDQGDEIKSMNTVVGDAQIGLSIKESDTVTQAVEINSIDPETISDVIKPVTMPVGLFSFKLTVASPGDIAHVRIYFSIAAPPDAIWYFYDAINGWTDYSEYATFSADRKSVLLMLKDGGFGDADGVENSTIVDPSGFGIASWIKGFVSDSSTGHKITTATLNFDDLDLNLNTLLDGNYVSMILPGVYNFEVSAPGYASKSYLNLVINEGEIITRDILLLPNQPSKVTHMAPIDSFLVSTPKFIWSKDIASTGYKFWIENSIGKKIVDRWYEAAQICSGNSCTIKLGIDLPEGSYEWSINSWNTSGNTWSDTTGFSIKEDNAPPSKIIHEYPYGDTAESSPAYIWNHDPASTWYKLWIGNPEGRKLFATWYDANNICSDGKCSVKFEWNLPSENCEWYVKSWNNLGNTWSDGMAFAIEVDETIPSKVVHSTPSNSTEDKIPTYTWVHDPASTWYKLWIGYPNGDRVFGQWYNAANICSGQNCSVTPNSKLSNGDFEWYVKSWNEFGKIWSDGMSFSTQGNTNTDK